MKKIAIVQSNYIPWKGYFDLIAAVDEFVLYDDVQFTKNDWRNRNRIRTPNGIEWISIPVGQDINRRVRDVRIPEDFWRGKHLRMLEANYRRASAFAEVHAVLMPIYKNLELRSLSQVNRAFLEAICAYLGIATKITNSWDYELSGDRSQRLVDICRQAGATQYMSGPSAKAYLDISLFRASRIEVVWMDYDGYPRYPQLWNFGFEHEVSIVDLLYNCGRESPRFMRVGS